MMMGMGFTYFNLGSTESAGQKYCCLSKTIMPEQKFVVIIGFEEKHKKPGGLA